MLLTNVCRIVAAACALGVAWPAPLPAGDDKTGAKRWIIAQRVVSQNAENGQTWQIDYRLQNAGDDAVVLTPDQIRAEVEGWVSNSRAAGHGGPRRSYLQWKRPFTPADSEIIAARDQAGRCAERGTFEVWSPSVGPEPIRPAARVMQSLTAPFGDTAIAVPDGGALCLRIRLAHDHFLYGAYEPLLGRRVVTIQLGDDGFRDDVELDRPNRAARAVPKWPALDPPADRLDRRVFLSPPSSLHLASHIPGRGNYRASGQVRYGTPMRLSFWYLFAPASQSEAVARVSQLKQGPALWKPLPDGQVEICLPPAPRWTRIDRIIRTEDEATNMTLEFRISGEMGDLWVDDVRVESLEPTDQGP